MHTMSTPQRRWGIAVIAAVVAWGTVGITPGQAQSGPEAPLIIMPIAPVAVSVPSIVPPITVGSAGQSRGGVIWSKSGRADVDVAIDEHHGRAVVP